MLTHIHLLSRVFYNESGVNFFFILQNEQAIWKVLEKSWIVEGIYFVDNIVEHKSHFGKCGYVLNTCIQFTEWMIIYWVLWYYLGFWKSEFNISFQCALRISTRAPIGDKDNQCHFRGLYSRWPTRLVDKVSRQSFEAKNQPVPWHGGTG